MKRSLVVAALLALLIAAPARSVPDGSAAGSAAHDAVACLGPPCGYITPLIDMDFPGKVKCSPQQADLSKCTPLPEDGASVKFEGTIRWYWKLSEDLTYPQTDPNAPVVISFAGSATNPKYLSFKAEPAEYTVDEVATFDPQNMKVDQSNPSAPVVYYWFERPLTITITRHGGPTAGELANVADHNWIQTFLVKAKSSSSGPYFKESFGVEQFGFNATSLRPVAQTTHASPAWGVMLPVGTLGAVAAGLRKRR